MSIEKTPAELIQSEHERDDEAHHTPGTMVLTLLLLFCFAVYYFANWKALSDVWYVR